MTALSDISSKISQAVALLGDAQTELQQLIPAPVPSGDVPASSVAEIPSNFDVTQWITSGETIPPSAAPDVVGAYRATINVSHYAYDCPIAMQTVPLQQYLGNSLTSDESTYQTLRTSGSGTSEGGPVNRSAYWYEALLVGGQIAVPNSTALYYKRYPSTSPRIPVGASVAPLPIGLKMVSSNVQFKGVRAGVDLCAYTTNFQSVLSLLKTGDQLFMVIDFPDLWDGQRIDSANHVDHMSTPVWNGNTGKFVAPAGYPCLIPTISLISQWTVVSGEDWTKAAFSGPVHGKYWEGWDTPTFRAIEANALEKMLNCNSGQIGDGRQLKRPPTFSFNQTPSRIPVSSVPADGNYSLIGAP